jgi:hypothetical protein
MATTFNDDIFFATITELNAKNSRQRILGGRADESVLRSLKESGRLTMRWRFRCARKR